MIIEFKYVCMNLIIDNNSKLSDIKKQFSDVYRFLKIEF